MMDQSHDLTVKRQAELLDIPRTGFYYQPVPIKPYDLVLMKLIDTIHMDYPYLGSRRMRNELRKLNHDVGRLHVATLMRKMGIEAIYPKKRLSIPNLEHTIYPYLLRGLVIDHPNQVWATDITYIPMKRGYCYLVAVLDWYSRKVLSWRLSNTLDTSFCTEALEEAISIYGRPEIFNTDQGSQFTTKEFTGVLKNNEIRISMDGKGRWVDNVFVERLCGLPPL
jgi:putative transposase